MSKLTWEQKDARARSRAAVTKGAALLDRANPNWFRRINLQTLDLASCTLCVAGQLAQTSRAAECEYKRTYEGYVKALSRRFGLGNERYPAFIEKGYGFVTYNSLDNAEGDRAYKVLEQMWEREIRKRLRAAEQTIDTRHADLQFTNDVGQG